MNKKILWIVLLLVILGVMVFGIVKSRKQEAKVPSQNVSFGKTNTVQNEVVENKVENKVENAVTENTASETEGTNTGLKGYVKTTLSDGVLYSKDGKQVKPDIVIDEKYYDTTINDIWLNPDSYKNKKIEIEGMYLENAPYTFCGRYTTSSLCPNCPPGFSYFEYQLDGDLDIKMTDGKEWIKVIGTLAVGNDATTNYTDFYYLKVLSLEVMNERGNETVNN